MKKEFVMRGQTASGETETLNFSGYKPGYAYRLVEFKLYPSEPGTTTYELCGSITAGKSAVSPVSSIDYNNEGLIATSLIAANTAAFYAYNNELCNDTFLITQNLILMAQDASGGSQAVNWQCRFVAEKMSGPEEAVANYKQFTISDE